MDAATTTKTQAHTQIQELQLQMQTQEQTQEQTQAQSQLQMQTQEQTQSQEIQSQLQTQTQEQTQTQTGWEPKIVAFLCNWCSYAGADLAGTSRLQYPPNIRVIRVPCSGRINPLYIIKALASGADGVMVSGCHPGDCHYLTGNMYARRRFTMLMHLLKTAGFEADRVHFTWVSASEGNRFAAVVEEVTGRVRQLGPNRITKLLDNVLKSRNQV